MAAALGFGCGAGAAAAAAGTVASVETAASWGIASGMLSRPRMAVAAAPTTRKQISATIVRVFVKKVSITADVWPF